MRRPVASLALVRPCTSQAQGTRFCPFKFNFIQQKSPTSVSGEMKAYWYSIQWGSNPS